MPERLWQGEPQGEVMVLALGFLPTVFCLLQLNKVPADQPLDAFADGRVGGEEAGEDLARG